VTGRADLFLGVIAVATLLIALVQVSIVVAAGLAARRLGRLASQIERDLRPLIDHATTIGRDASRAAALAAAQVERADRLFGDLAQKLEQTMATLQASVAVPAREGWALLSGFKAAMAAIRAMRDRGGSRSRGDDEDALFI
jgi:hypothetical protein